MPVVNPLSFVQNAERRQTCQTSHAVLKTSANTFSAAERIRVPYYYTILEQLLSTVVAISCNIN